MTIDSHTTEADGHLQKDGRRRIFHYFVDHLGKSHRRGPIWVPGAWTETEYLSERTGFITTIEDGLAAREVSDAYVGIEFDANYDNTSPQHQSQADFDRRLLGLLMTVSDIHHFRNALTFFQAVESRGGANAIQRAAYLGVTSQDYSLVANRFSDLQGALTFIDDEKDHVWDVVLEGFK